MGARTLVVLFVVGLVAVGAAVASANGRWSTHLTGAAERPTPVVTQAQGQATLKLSQDGETLHYQVISSNIVDITQAHIHLITDPALETGGIVVWLYPDGPPPVLIPGRHDGVLAQGSITEGDFVNALAGASMETLVDALESGAAYVNVHTSANPPGEIRGNIR
jgi:hypothetical protein